MTNCKKCNSQNCCKNGFVRGKQRFKCLNCKYNFVEGDSRTLQSTIIKRSLAVILYSLGKSSMGFIAKLFSVSPPTVLKWIRKEGNIMQDLAIDSTIQEVEIDEMWHFIQSKKTKNGFSKPLIVADIKQLHGLQVTVVLQQLESYTSS
jgi:transposase